MIKIDIDRMAKILRVPTLAAYEETLTDYDAGTFSYVYKAAIEEGLSDDQARDKAMDAEWQEQSVACTEYRDKLVAIWEQEIEKVGLVCSELSTQRNQFSIMPKTSWKDAANEMRTIVQGIGGWYTNTLKEFLATGPYTPRSMVDNHLGYVGQQWELYGYSKPATRIYK